MINIAYDAGHGMYTLGKRCDKSLDPKETREWELNNRIANYVERNLSDNYTGFEFIRLDDRSGQTDITLKERVIKANEFDADIVVSVHHNAGAKLTNAGGIVAYVAKVSSANSKMYQKALYNSLIKNTGLIGNRTNPMDTANFYMVKYTTSPAVLVEHGFMDSKMDTPIILTDKFAKSCAKAHVEFLVDTFKLKGTKEISFRDSLEILAEHEVISSPKYWITCSKFTPFIKELFIKVAKKLEGM